MKKRITRIQRWLNRLSAACENGSWDSAVIETDCLSAEVRELREDLSNMITEDASRRIFWGADALAMSFRSVGIALFIVLVSTIPLAVEAEKPWSAQTTTASAKRSGAEFLTWVTKEEDQLLQVLRADLSGQNVSVTQQPEVFRPLKKKADPRPLHQESVAAVDKAALRVAPMASSSGISAEDLLALVQIGEKALRGESPAIKVIK